MKIMYLAFIFACAASFVSANEIDNLKTNKQVNNFLAATVLKKDSEIVVLDENKTNAAQYGKNKFYKLDLDNNGLTDLVVDGKYLLAVTDKGENQYSLHLLDRGAFALNKYTLTNIVYKDKTPLLVVRKYIVDFGSENEDNGKIGGKETEQTLIFKFENFIEYNEKPDDFRIEQIEFSTSGCYGSCPIFKLLISQNKKAAYDAIDYNDRKGKYKTVIDTNSFNKIVETINYMGLASLKNEYSVPWTDLPGSTLEIKYDNGKIKKISDYGMIGTFGLENLYDQLSALRKTQNWMK